MRRALAAAGVCATVLTGVAACASEAPAPAGAPATGFPAVEVPGATVPVVLLVPRGTWSVRREVVPGSELQQALDALVAGPDDSERARGLSSSLPSDSEGLRGTVSDGRVDVHLPWNLSDLPPGSRAIEQIACTAAASPEVPGGRPPAEVLVALHEPIDPASSTTVLCGATGTLRPMLSDG